MNRRRGFLALIVACSIADAEAPNATPNEAKPTTHSLAELSYLIGDWTCLTTIPGKGETQMTAHYEWIYNGKVLKETLTSPQYSGTFLTSFDARSNTFKGVGVGSDGTPFVWENTGATNGKSNETGFVFGAGKLVQASRTETEIIDQNHYVIRDFGPDTPKGPGVLTDTEDCMRKK